MIEHGQHLGSGRCSRSQRSQHGQKAIKVDTLPISSSASIETTKIYLRMVPGHLREEYDKAMPTIAVTA